MPISLRCNGCGQKYRVPDTAAGRSTKCRKCGAVIVIPSSVGIAVQPQAPPPVATAETVDFAPSVMQASPPKPLRKKKGKKGLILALVGVAVAFFGCVILSAGGAVAWWLLSGGDDGMKYLPSNPQLIISTRWHDIADSDLATQIKKALPPDATKDWSRVNEEMTEIGLTTDDFDRLLVGGNVSTQEWSMVLTCRKPIDVQKVLKAGNNKGKKYKEVKVGKYTIYEEESASAGNGPAVQGFPGAPVNLDAFKQVAMCCPESKIMMTGPTKALQSILQRGKKPDFSEGMKAAMSYADMKKPIAIAVDVKSIKSGFPQIGNKPAMGFEKVDGAAVNITIKTDLAIDATLLCSDAASAETLRKGVEGVIALGKSQFGEMIGSEGVATLDALKFTNNGNTVLASVQVKGTDVVKAVGKFKPVAQPVDPQPAVEQPVGRPARPPRKR